MTQVHRFLCTHNQEGKDSYTGQLRKQCIERGADMEEVVKLEGDILWIRLPKELDHHNCGAIREAADRMLLQHPVREVLFDFADTEFMDSSGIGVIVGRYKNIKCFGGSVSAIHLNERIRKIFLLSGLSKMITIYEQEA